MQVIQGDANLFFLLKIINTIPVVGGEIWCFLKNIFSLVKKKLLEKSLVHSELLWWFPLCLESMFIISYKFPNALFEYPELSDIGNWRLCNYMWCKIHLWTETYPMRYFFFISSLPTTGTAKEESRMGQQSCQYPSPWKQVSDPVVGLPCRLLICHLHSH